jgi:hypothetical protein
VTIPAQATRNGRKITEPLYAATKNVKKKVAIWRPTTWLFSTPRNGLQPKSSYCGSKESKRRRKDSMEGIVHYFQPEKHREKFKDHVIVTLCGKEIQLPLDNPRSESYVATAPYFVTCHKCEGILLTDPELAAEKKEMKDHFRRENDKLSPELQALGMWAGDASKALAWGLSIGMVIVLASLIFCH